MFGVVSGPGTRDFCFGTYVFTKVASPAVLNWIRTAMGEKAFLTINY